MIKIVHNALDLYQIYNKSFSFEIPHDMVLDIDKISIQPTNFGVSAPNTLYRKIKSIVPKIVPLYYQHFHNNLYRKPINNIFYII